MDDANTPAVPDQGPSIPAKGRETKALLERAIAGDPTCEKLLDGLLGLPDRGAKIIGLFGNLPSNAEQVVIDGLAGENILVREAIRRKMESLRAELAGPEPTPIERLLAERAAYCWLVVWQYEHRLAREDGLTIRQADFHHRRIDAAHRRYLSSLRTLAQVRKLDLPAVQINLGGNQVNVSGG